MGMSHSALVIPENVMCLIALPILVKLLTHSSFVKIFISSIWDNMQFKTVEHVKQVTSIKHIIAQCQCD